MAFDPQYGTIPLGSLPTERHLAAPYNAAPQAAIVEVRNLSASVERLVVKEAISIRRGGDAALKRGPYSGKEYVGTSVDQLRWRVAQGENMNWEIKQVKPTDWILRHNSQEWVIWYNNPKDPNGGGEPPWIAVNEGAWDLYMGNWERMHSEDVREKQREAQRLQGRGYFKYVLHDDNPYGFLEFRRRPIEAQQIDVDKSIIAGRSIMEV